MEKQKVQNIKKTSNKKKVLAEALRANLLRRKNKAQDQNKS